MVCSDWYSGGSGCGQVMLRGKKEKATGKHGGSYLRHSGASKRHSQCCHLLEDSGCQPTGSAWTARACAGGLVGICRGGGVMSAQGTMCSGIVVRIAVACVCVSRTS